MPAASVMAPLRAGEFISPALRTVRTILRLPLWLKKVHATLLRWLSRPRGRNNAWASLLEVFHPKSTLEERRLVVEREAYRAAWHEAWNREGLDFVLTVPHALPAVPTDPRASDRATLVSANYAFLYNVVRRLRFPFGARPRFGAYSPDVRLARRLRRGPPGGLC